MRIFAQSPDTLLFPPSPRPDLPYAPPPLLPSAQPRPELSRPRRPHPRKSCSIRVLSRGGHREWLYDEQGEEPTPETETSWRRRRRECALCRPRPMFTPYWTMGGSLVSNFPLRREYHIRSLTLKTLPFEVLFVTSPLTPLFSLLDNRDALPVPGLLSPPFLRRWWGLRRRAGAESSGRCRWGAGDAAASLPF